MFVTQPSLQSAEGNCPTPSGSASFGKILARPVDGSYFVVRGVTHQLIRSVGPCCVIAAVVSHVMSTVASSAVIAAEQVAH